MCAHHRFRIKDPDSTDEEKRQEVMHSMLHRRRSRMFYVLMNLIKDSVTVCFDVMENLVLPKPLSVRRTIHDNCPRIHVGGDWEAFDCKTEMNRFITNQCGFKILTQFLNSNLSASGREDETPTTVAVDSEENAGKTA